MAMSTASRMCTGSATEAAVWSCTSKISVIYSNASSRTPDTDLKHLRNTKSTTNN